MKSFFDRWVAKDIAGEDKIEADEKNSDVGNDKGTEQGDEGRSGAATDKPAHQEETKTASIDPKVSAKGKEKRTSSPPDIGKQTATQRKAAKKQAKRAIKSAVPESTTEAKAAAPSPENEEDTSGRNTTWVVNLPRNDADTEESRQEKVRAIMALITGKEKSQVESRAPSATRERGTILGVCYLVLFCCVMKCITNAQAGDHRGRRRVQR